MEAIPKSGIIRPKDMDIFMTLDQHCYIAPLARLPHSLAGPDVPTLQAQQEDQRGNVRWGGPTSLPSTLPSPRKVLLPPSWEGRARQGRKGMWTLWEMKQPFGTSY